MKLSKKQEREIKLELVYWHMQDLDQRQENPGLYIKTSLAAWYGVRSVVGDDKAKELDSYTFQIADQLHRQGVNYWNLQRGRYEDCNSFISIL